MIELESGFGYTWQCGNSAERIEVFKKEFKKHVDAGKFIRDIQNAPRDARYKIDHYYKEGILLDDLIPLPYSSVYKDVLNFLNIDKTFNWTEKLKNNKGYHKHGDFTIGYDEFPIGLIYPNGGKDTCGQYYFKYKGEINKLDFMSSPTLVDYTSSFWSKYRDMLATYNSVHDLIHNLNYFIIYKNIKIK